MRILEQLIIRLKSKFIGVDEYGNKYYESKRPNKWNRKSRFVCYTGKNEATKITTPWHDWIHYKTNIIPKDYNKDHNWQRQRIPNLTGTVHSVSVKLTKKKNYKAWSPND